MIPKALSPRDVLVIVTSISLPLSAAATLIPAPALKCNLLLPVSDKLLPLAAATSGLLTVASDNKGEPSASHLS